ncbi:MAG: helix-turn-helix transcriptional regulator [Pseudomonadales bacterium]|nr:helix-turn-helix transcriptional regulator [Pseudomonadales bacterium]MCP5183908.1 helix-turn-helix transcriptional regulator [Pseudomonadales bacterium]
MTLAMLSGASGISTANISKTENGLISPTYDVLENLARGLGITFSELVSDQDVDAADTQRSEAGLVSVNQGQPEAPISSAQYDYFYLSGDLQTKRMVPIIMDLKARSLDDFGELIVHGGEEFIYVLRGRVDVITANHAPQRLRAGDSMYLDSGTGHAFLAAGRLPARILTIATEPLLPATSRRRRAPRGKKA